MNILLSEEEYQSIKLLILRGLFSNNLDNKQWALYKLAELLNVDTDGGDYCDPGVEPKSIR